MPTHWRYPAWPVTAAIVDPKTHSGLVELDHVESHSKSGEVFCWSDHWDLNADAVRQCEWNVDCENDPLPIMIGSCEDLNGWKVKRT